MEFIICAWIFTIYVDSWTVNSWFPSKFKTFDMSGPNTELHNWVFICHNETQFTSKMYFCIMFSCSFPTTLTNVQD